jgi:CheY-like chemotaxis protein
MLGHELRNPLAPILTALQLMQLRGNAVFEKERLIIDRQVRHVVRLVDDLLEVSRITRGKISLDRAPIDLATVVANGIEVASPLLEQRSHHLTVDVPPGLVVYGDTVRLGQVLANLLTNAAKYTPSGGHIHVAADRQGASARIRVKDTGIGIRREMLPKVFDHFVQERQSLDRSQGGLGLGLAIVRALVEMHGGSVEAESEGPGHGSEFTIRLPICEMKVLPPSPAGERRREPSRGLRRILVVDDNEDAADSLAEVLTELGHSVETAHDGAEALAKLETFTPEVAFLDIGLPVMDGYELARRIRELPRMSDIRLVAVTGYGQASDQLRSEEAGFTKHLVKPVNLSTIEGALSANGRGSASSGKRRA